VDHDRWLISRAPNLGRQRYRGGQGSARGRSRREVDGEAYSGGRCRDLGTSVRAIRSERKIIFTGRQAGRALSPWQRVERVRGCEGSSRNRPYTHHELSRRVEDTDVVIIRRIVRGCYFVGYLCSSDCVRQKESPKSRNVFGRSLSGPGTRPEMVIDPALFAILMFWPAVSVLSTGASPVFPMRICPSAGAAVEVTLVGLEK
jgi:hypothetical protein